MAFCRHSSGIDPIRGLEHDGTQSGDAATSRCRASASLRVLHKVGQPHYRARHDHSFTMEVAPVKQAPTKIGTMGLEPYWLAVFLGAFLLFAVYTGTIRFRAQSELGKRACFTFQTIGQHVLEYFDKGEVGSSSPPRPLIPEARGWKLEARVCSTPTRAPYSR